LVLVVSNERGIFHVKEKKEGRSKVWGGCLCEKHG